MSWTRSSEETDVRRLTTVTAGAVTALVAVGGATAAGAATPASVTASGDDGTGHRLVTYLVVAIVVGVLLLVVGIVGLVKTRDVRRGRHR